MDFTTHTSAAEGSVDPRSERTTEGGEPRLVAGPTELGNQRSQGREPGLTSAGRGLAASGESMLAVPGFRAHCQEPGLTGVHWAQGRRDIRASIRGTRAYGLELRGGGTLYALLWPCIIAVHALPSHTSQWAQEVTQRPLPAAGMSRRTRAAWTSYSQNT